MMPDEHARRERKIDEALEETFPASDTPSFVGAGAHREKKPEADEKHVGRRVG